MKVSVVIVAAGKGKRFCSEIEKQFLNIDDKPVIFWTLENFLNHKLINEIVLVVPEQKIRYVRKEILKNYNSSKTKLVNGGITRQDSVYNGLNSVSNNSDYVLIHDGVRPFTPLKIINQVIAGTIKYKACLPALKIEETVKKVDAKKSISCTIPHKSLWIAQTPQGFSLKLIKDAYKKAYQEGFKGTDDASLVERLGIKVKVIPGSILNFKITRKKDLELLELIKK